MSDKITSIRSLIMALAAIIFASTLFDAIYGFKSLIQPGISLVYNAIGTQLAPNMVTLVVFDWRAFDTLGESLILVTAVLVVLLVFGKGKILDKNINSDINEGDDEGWLKEKNLQIGIRMTAALY